MKRKEETPKMQAAPPPLPEIQVPDFVFSTSEQWKQCKECGEWIWHDWMGKEYYHRIYCSKTNGTAYRADRG